MFQGAQPRTGRAHQQPSQEIPAEETQDTSTQQHRKRRGLEEHAHRENQQTTEKETWQETILEPTL